VHPSDLRLLAPGLRPPGAKESNQDGNDVLGEEVEIKRKVYTPPKDCVPPARHLPAMLRNARPPAMQSEADGRGRRVAAPQALSGGSA